MASLVALLRAVNVGGNKLPMKDLKAMAEAAGYESVRTYIASGNLLLCTDEPAEQVRATLEARLEEFFGKPMDLLLRSAAQLRELVERNPYSERPGNRVVVLFLDRQAPADLRPAVEGIAGETFQVLGREIFIDYPEGQGRSKLAFPDLGVATARNMNTVTKLAELASDAG